MIDDRGGETEMPSRFLSWTPCALVKPRYVHCFQVNVSVFNGRVKKSKFHLQPQSQSWHANLIVDELRPGKNAAAVEWGRLGGLKGGKAMPIRADLYQLHII